MHCQVAHSVKQPLSLWLIFQRPSPFPYYPITPFSVLHWICLSFLDTVWWFSISRMLCISFLCVSTRNELCGNVCVCVCLCVLVFVSMRLCCKPGLPSVATCLLNEKPSFHAHKAHFPTGAPTFAFMLWGSMHKTPMYHLMSLEDSVFF